MMISKSTGARAPRRDGLANRELIFSHAERVFASEGFSVSLHRIAKDLGMGIGTVYRHFPAHEDLVLGLYERFQERMDAACERVLAIHDPYERVIAFIDITVEIAFEFPIARSLASEARRYLPEEPRPGWVAGVVIAAVRDAHMNGDLRADITASDIAVIAGMLADLVHQPEAQRETVLRRMRSILLDGIQSAEVSPPPLPGGTISTQDVVDIVHDRDRHNRST